MTKTSMSLKRVLKLLRVASGLVLRERFPLLRKKKEYRDWSLGIWNKFKSINGRRETGLYCRLQVCNSQRLIWAEICPLYTSARIGVGVKAIWNKE